MTLYRTQHLSSTFGLIVLAIAMALGRRGFAADRQREATWSTAAKIAQDIAEPGRATDKVPDGFPDRSR
jgi:hypothetical protein